MKQQSKVNIFNTTNCLNRDQMLGYLRNELAPFEKHLVEKHLVDCDLCNDALEGFSLISNPDFIDQTVMAVKEITPVRKIKTQVSFRIWLAAASVILIIISTLWFYHSSYQPYPNQVAQETMPRPALYQPKDIGFNPNHSIKQPAIIVKKNTDTNKLVLESSQQNVTSLDADRIDQIQTKRTGSRYATEEVLEKEDAISEPEIKTSEAPVTTYEGYASEAPAMKEISAANPSTLKDNVKNKDAPRVRYIEGMKTRIYETPLKTADSTVLVNKQRVETRFENGSEKNKVFVEEDQNREDFTYSEVLEQGIHNLQQKNYIKASALFEELLKTNPGDENALFYGALSYASLGRFERARHPLQRLTMDHNGLFYEEAKWNLALLEVQSGNRNKAIKLLKEIEIAKGFYSRQASVKLAEIK